MSRALYLFVREGVAKDIEPQPRGINAGMATPPEDAEEAAIRMGEDGGDKVFPYWMYSTVTLETGTFTEIKRETTQKRVENPDDPSQYVMVDQIDKLHLKNATDPTDQRILEMKNPK